MIKSTLTFPIFEARNENCHAKDALSIDPGYLVSIRMRGRYRDGNEWSRFLKASGDKSVKKANNVFDWLTDTGMTQFHGDSTSARRVKGTKWNTHDFGFIHDCAW